MSAEGEKPVCVCPLSLLQVHACLPSLELDHALLATTSKIRFLLLQKVEHLVVLSLNVVLRLPLFLVLDRGEELVVFSELTHGTSPLALEFSLKPLPLSSVSIDVVILSLGKVLLESRIELLDRFDRRLERVAQASPVRNRLGQSLLQL